MSKVIIYLINTKEQVDSFLIKTRYPKLINLMKSGDLIENIHESGYRSDGVYIYDGIDVIDLDYEYDDYGSIPKKFISIVDFRIGYWDFHNDTSNNKSLQTNDIYCKGKLSKFYWHTNMCYVNFALLGIKKDLEQLISNLKHIHDKKYSDSNKTYTESEFIKLKLAKKLYKKYDDIHHLDLNYDNILKSRLPIYNKETGSFTKNHNHLKKYDELERTKLFKYKFKYKSIKYLLILNIENINSDGVYLRKIYKEEYDEYLKDNLISYLRLDNEKYKNYSILTSEYY